MKESLTEIETSNKISGRKEQRMGTRWYLRDNGYGYILEFKGNEVSDYRR